MEPWHPVGSEFQQKFFLNLDSGVNPNFIGMTKNTLVANIIFVLLKYKVRNIKHFKDICMHNLSK